MGYLSSQLSIANSLPTIESAPFFGNKLKRLDMSLLVEIALVTTAAILAIRVSAAGFISRSAWFVAPGIFIAAAIIPIAIKRGEFAKIGFNIRQIRHSLVVLGWTCVAVFPPMFSCCWLLKSYGLELPLRPVLPQNQVWVYWLFYQFMYVAVAEEVFFRGYVQSNILRLTNPVMSKLPKLQQWTCIVISAAVFAVAHIIIQGKIISVLTFLPGLILGWLLIRTKSLLAPILFHGLANTFYYALVSVSA